MSKLRRIVVGYNFLPDGEVAFHSARILAEQAHAMLYVLHVVEPSPIFEQKPTPTPPALTPLEAILGNVREQLRALAATPELARLHVTTNVHTGKPFVELIRECHRWSGDLIVVGVSEQGTGRFLGSTAERVLRKAPVPVLIAKRLLTSGPKTLLIPTDFSACSQAAAHEALALVQTFGGRVVFLHVMESYYLYPPAYGVAPDLTHVSPDVFEASWQEFLHDLPLGGGLKWEKQTREGRTAEIITNVAAEIGADLIVMGTHGRTGLPHLLLGSVAEKVVRLSACSVLTVRPSAFRFELP
ncbi:MAG: universal stress protein [Deltaproteobacteria bacterium]|nr:universal stress protein [Deltaproteobacteria bacterium]